MAREQCSPIARQGRYVVLYEFSWGLASSVRKPLEAAVSMGVKLETGVQGDHSTAVRSGILPETLFDWSSCSNASDMVRDIVCIPRRS